MHRESRNIADAASSKVSRIQSLVRWARPPVTATALRSLVLVPSVTCCGGYCGAEKSKNVTRNGIDRREKRYKVKFVLLLLLSLILMIYIRMVLKVWSLMFSERTQPKNVLRRIQSLLINKQILHSPLTTIRQRPTQEAITDTDYFIIFDADIPGQGTGNLISGLLASHLLGDEFQRIVCVNPLYYSSFLDVFESIDPVAQRKCPSILHRITVNNATYYKQNPQHMVTIINFLGAADECYLKNFLSDRTKQIIHIVGNTYPRWPTVPDYYFFHHYQPKPVLFDNLPYQNQPKIVVHLRDPDDGEVDPRLGLDDASLVALGDLLPKSHDTYLVSNNVDYFDRFTKCCSWSHAKWELVKHSATDQYWGKADYSDDRSPDTITKQKLQMWSDWYTILMAESVYHTHSDFSISAIHWMNNRNSHSILGYDTDTQKLETTVESWWRDGETIPLVQRTIEGKPGTTNELRACG